MALTFRIKGELRTDCLKGALEDVVARHESLRTRIVYDESDGNLGFQEVLPPLSVPLTVHDIPAMPGRSRDQVAIDLLNELNDEGLDFFVTPSLRAVLHRFDDHDAVLTLITHHLFSDGWSGGILRRELAACYRARVTGVPYVLPKPVPYREFAAWEQEYLQGARGARARRFWQNKLADAEFFALPADRPHGPDNLTLRPAVGNFAIEQATFARITASAAQNRCSGWQVVLAAFMVLAARVTGRTDITLPAVNSGRPTRDFYDTIGLFADLVPIRLEFGNCRSFLDLMLLARRASAEAQQYQIPYRTVLEMFPGLLRGVADPDLVVPGFNYISSSWAGDESKSAIDIEQVLTPEEPPGYFLRGAFKWNFRVASPGEFRCTVEYEPAALDEDTVNRWGSDFLDLMVAIADRPDQPWQDR